MYTTRSRLRLTRVLHNVHLPFVVIFMTFVYAVSGCPKICYGVHTCNTSVVNLGWPIRHCWHIFQMCLVLPSCFSCYCLRCGLKECGTDALLVNGVTSVGLRKMNLLNVVLSSFLWVSHHNNTEHPEQSFDLQQWLHSGVGLSTEWMFVCFWLFRFPCY